MSLQGTTTIPEQRVCSPLVTRDFVAQAWLLNGSQLCWRIRASLTSVGVGFDGINGSGGIGLMDYPQAEKLAECLETALSLQEHLDRGELEECETLAQNLIGRIEDCIDDAVLEPIP